MYDPRREEEILRFWNENQIFQKSLEKTKDGEPFIFYDGPPFATGLPHFGHVLPTTIKDVIPRYQTMRGRFVPRVWGWDCHGLPIENLVEKKLGLKNKKDIENYGVDKFNIEARNSVLNFDSEWKKIIPRLGRWIDMDHAYLTMNPSFTESVWWSFKTLYDKGLVYEGFYSMHLCPHCGTVLSNFEVGLGYKDISDISVTVEFELGSNSTGSPSTSSGQSKIYVLVWTTTPWTLPGNVALAVNPGIEYSEVEGMVEGNKYIVASSRIKEVFGEKFKILKTFSGKDLIGKSYKPIFDYYSANKDLPNRQNGWKIYGADFVNTEEGTGIVHIAPAFGEDDLNLGLKEKLPFVQHVNQEGKIKPEVRDFANMPVKPKSDDSQGHQKTDIEILKALAEKDLLFSKEKITHSYPHCWRCETPLLNYATSSWFIKVTEFKDKLVKENKKINWTPDHVGTNRFGKWLENARDWSISRTRYWGAPLPIWVYHDEETHKDQIEILGSIEELKSKISKNNYFALRHGESEHNVENLVSAVSEPKYLLTEKGKKEVIAAANNLKKEKIDLIISSPLPRTKETVELISKEIEFKGEIIFDERISEIKFGDLEGKSFSDYLAFFSKFRGKERLETRMPKGESLLDVRNRVAEFLYEIDEKYQDKNILYVSHSGIIKMMELISAGDYNELFFRWDSRKDVKTGQLEKLNFVSLPHNEKYELDLHRPYIDKITWTNKSGKLMKRIPDVFDTWYDSGSMPYASRHYPFENLQDIDKGRFFPSDFIAEGVEQTRGWFYSLIVLNTALFGKAPYKHVVVNGTILAEDGRKMSKSLNNYPPLAPTIEKYGADALRYFLLSSPAVKAEEMNFSEKSLDEIVKKHFNRLYNVFSLYEMYKDKVQDWNAHIKTKNVLDLWVKTRLYETGSKMTKYLDNYELDKATELIGNFIDDLSTWYVRRSRERFKSEDSADRDVALSTTGFVLFEFSKLMAPFIPFLAEDLYQKLSLIASSLKSVHLENWPVASKDWQKKPAEQLIKQMEELRKVVTLGLELRAKAGIKVRQPLSRLMIKDDPADLSEDDKLLSLIRDEVNVKEVIFDAQINEPAVLDTKITDQLRKEGTMREIVRAIQEERKEKNLKPGDRIEVVIRSSVEIHHLVSEFKDMVSKITFVDNFLFEETRPEEKLEGGKEFVIRIV